MSANATHLMSAVLLEEFGPPEVLKRASLPAPRPAADQVLVAVRACGVCGHDLLARAGALGTPLPMVIGHEIAGEVVEVGSEVTSLSVGQRVALVQRIPCGHCRVCRRGATNLCREGLGFYGEEHTGGYGEFVVASELNAVALPDTISFVTGSILSCGVGTGFRALRRARLERGDVVVITGAGGGVGLNAVSVAVSMGLRVVAVSSSADKHAAIRAAGADDVLGPLAPRDARQAIRDRTDGWGADAVIEVAGPPTFASSVAMLAPGGRLILVGNTVPGPVEINPGLSILKELEILGSAHATREDLEEVIGLVEAGQVSPSIGAVTSVWDAAGLHRAMEARTVAGRGVLEVTAA